VKGRKKPPIFQKNGSPYKGSGKSLQPGGEGQENPPPSGKHPGKKRPEKKKEKPCTEDWPG